MSFAIVICKTFLQVDKNYIAKVESETRSGEGKIWKRHRLYRITASKAGAVCRATDKCQSLLTSILYAQDVNTKATMHGKLYESEALKKYSALTDNIVTRCGFIIDEERPFVGATPDGLVGEQVVVEVKCPYSAKHKNITPQTVPYLEESDGALHLKHSHDYYYQVQLQMQLPKRTYCHFVVYTLCDLKVIIIPKDYIFISDMLKQFDIFFEKKLKCAIIKKLMYKSYHDYKSF